MKTTFAILILLATSFFAHARQTETGRGVKEDTDTIAPDITVEADSKSYFEASDTVLERVINWKETGPE